MMVNFGKLLLVFNFLFLAPAAWAGGGISMMPVDNANFVTSSGTGTYTVRKGDYVVNIRDVEGGGVEVTYFGPNNMALKIAPDGAVENTAGFTYNTRDYTFFNFAGIAIPAYQVAPRDVTANDGNGIVDTGTSGTVVHSNAFNTNTKAFRFVAPSWIGAPAVE